MMPSSMNCGGENGTCATAWRSHSIWTARLAYALACPQNDVTLADLCALSDVFYIGGTKVGALCGEAVVFTRHNTPKHFLTRIKQHGALLAKGRLLGIQFDTLFTDNLYFEIGKPHWEVDISDIIYTDKAGIFHCS